ncbi:hypothetical protein [Bradyrhizobium sp. RDM4]|uniref:hypothetical protein n=1 Tax=Bradyrhizobium sp. RDM4 TaxID=3378765 RepID=UPI0038FBE83E
MITEGVVKIRPFGKNDQTIACDCSGTTIFANGNNIRIVGDLVRRTLTTRLDTKSESPETRSFDFDPVDEVKADRGKYLAAAFTIARAYMAAGSPNAETIPLAGFSGWSRVVREPLIWLGLPDPVQSMESARSLDPERGELRQRIAALTGAFGIEKEFTAAEVCRKAIETSHGGSALAHPGLLEAFSRTDGRPLTAKSIGHQLMKHAGRVSAGLLIELAVSNDRNGHRYRIKSNGVESADGVTEAL